MIDSFVNHFDGHFAYLKTLDFSFKNVVSCSLPDFLSDLFLPLGIFGHCMIFNILFLFEFFVTCLHYSLWWWVFLQLNFVIGCYLREINNACLDVEKTFMLMLRCHLNWNFKSLQDNTNLPWVLFAGGIFFVLLAGDFFFVIYMCVSGRRCSGWGKGGQL